MAIYNYVYEKPARKHFQCWYNWAVRSRLEPMKKVAGMLKRRFENIMTYLSHPITNATRESINAKIQWVKYTARGFRNKQNFINAIYFHCGGLDWLPAATKKPDGPTNSFRFLRVLFDAGRIHFYHFTLPLHYNDAAFGQKFDPNGDSDEEQEQQFNTYQRHVFGGGGVGKANTARKEAYEEE